MSTIQQQLEEALMRLTDFQQELMNAHENMREFEQSVRSHMSTYLPPMNTLPNFALHSLGARVLRHISSDTQWQKSVWRKMVDTVYPSPDDQPVIQGDAILKPGMCSCFLGEKGHFIVSLSHPATVTHVTLGHIHKSQSPTGQTENAPRSFSVYGMTSRKDQGTHLGTWVYDNNGHSFQTFKLPQPRAEAFEYVKLQVENNWGHKDHTCLYSFRVHGAIYKKK